MAATIQITVHDEQVREFLAGLLARIGDLTPLMRNIGEIIRERAMQSFASGTSPAGIPWKPSVRALREGGRTLIDTATLRNSIHVQPSRSEVSVGTPVEYGGTHQFGAERGAFGRVSMTVKAHMRTSRKGKKFSVRSHVRQALLPWGNIPARPFLGVAPEDWNEIHDAVLDYAMRGAR
jgi:phage virion morphogenesis protein